MQISLALFASTSQLVNPKSKITHLATSKHFVLNVDELGAENKMS